MLVHVCLDRDPSPSVASRSLARPSSLPRLPTPFLGFPAIISPSAPLPMDFFSTQHASQQAEKNDNANTDMFAKAIDDRFNAISSRLSSITLPNPRPFVARPLPAALQLTLPPTLASSSSRPVIPPPRPNLPNPLQPTQSTEFPSVSPSDLPDLLSDPRTLILDIRTLANHHVSRLPNAVPLTVPSTLLKRPLFSTDKLADMLPTRVTRRKFSAWRSAPRILVYDADAPVLTHGSNILGLLRKFRTEYAAQAPPDQLKPPLELLWLKGGFQAVWRERRDLVDKKPLLDRDEDEEDPAITPADSATAILRTRHLPMAAFYIASTTSQRSGANAHHQQYLDVHRRARSGEASGARPTGSAIGGTISTGVSVTNVGVGTGGERGSDGGAGGGVGAGVGGASDTRALALAPSNPFYDNVRQNLELSQGVTERIPLRISKSAKERVNDLPFVWLREIGRWAAIEGEEEDEEEDEHEEVEGSGAEVVTEGVSESLSSADDDSEMYDDESVADSSSSGNSSELEPGNVGDGDADGDLHPRQHQHHVRFPTSPDAVTGTHGEKAKEAIAEGSEALAMQFYRIELGEQRRLMGVMEHHSRESGRVLLEGELVHTPSAKDKKKSKRRRKPKA